MIQIDQPQNDMTIGLQEAPLFFSSTSDDTFSNGATFKVGSSQVSKDIKINGGNKDTSRYILDYTIQAVAGSGTAGSNVTYVIAANQITEISQVILKGASYSSEMLNVSDLNIVTRLLGPLMFDSKERSTLNRYIYSDGTKSWYVNRGANVNSADPLYVGAIPVKTEEYQNIITIGTTSGTTLTSRPKRFCIELADLCPMSYLGIDKVLELLGTDTLTLYFPDVSKVVMKYTTAGGLLTAADSVEVSYEISNLRIRRFDYMKFKRVQEIQMKTNIIYVPEYAVQNQSLDGSSQPLELNIPSSPGSYLLAVIYGASITSSVPGAIFEPTNLMSSTYSIHNFKSFKVELNNTPLLLYSDPSDYVNYMTSIVKHLKNHSLISDKAIEYYGGIPIFFDSDYENIFNPNYNVGRGLSLDMEQNIKITITTPQQYNGLLSNSGDQKRQCYALGIILKPYYLVNGVLSVNPPIQITE